MARKEITIDEAIRTLVKQGILPRNYGRQLRLGAKDIVRTKLRQVQSLRETQEARLQKFTALHRVKRNEKDEDGKTIPFTGKWDNPESATRFKSLQRTLDATINRANILHARLGHKNRESSYDPYPEDE